MNKFIKASTFILASLIFTACAVDNTDGRFNFDNTSGWIQFQQASSANIVIDEYDVENSFDIPILVNIPVTPKDIVVTYTLQSVSGQDPNTFFTNGNTVDLPAEEYGYANVGDYPVISLDINEVQNITEVMVFDVVLESTDAANVTVGIDGSTRPTSHRVTICPTLNSSSGAFIGDYILTVPSGPGPFGDSFEDGITVTISEGFEGPFSRVFQADYLPGIAAGLPVVDINFSFVDGEVIIADGILTGVGCGAQILLGGDSDNIDPQPCGDSTITLNMLDFQNGSGNCGAADVPMTLLLTKV